MSEKSPQYVAMVTTVDPPAYTPSMLPASPVKRKSGKAKIVLITVMVTLLSVVILGALGYVVLRNMDSGIGSSSRTWGTSDNPSITFVGMKDNQIIYEARNKKNELVFVNSARGTVLLQNKLIGEADLGAFTMGPLAHRRLVMNFKDTLTGNDIEPSQQGFSRPANISPRVLSKYTVTWTLVLSDGHMILFEDDVSSSNHK